VSQLPSTAVVEARVAALAEMVADGRMVLEGSSHEGPVLLAPPDPAWVARFGAVRAQLAAALGSTALRIEHVGSTAVPGLAAKPVIDIQVSVADLTDEAAYVPQIAALGWPLRLRDDEHRFFREPAGVPRTTHVHVCAAGSRWERAHLLFRDYLRAHPARAAAYGELKWALAERYRDERVSYTEAKGPFIDETRALADKWAPATGWRVGQSNTD
jgi:GrpB-like predicted nucleotidyltransferase (UPF0157 family)